MNMVQTTGPGGVPAVVSVSSGFTFEGEKYVNDTRIPHGCVGTYLHASFNAPSSLRRQITMDELHLLHSCSTHWLGFGDF
jgi:hypothetical protein